MTYIIRLSFQRIVKQSRKPWDLVENFHKISSTQASLLCGWVCVYSVHFLLFPLVSSEHSTFPRIRTELNCILTTTLYIDPRTHTGKLESFAN